MFVTSIIMVKGLPSYIFFLKCCFKPDCMHPLCKLGPSHAVQTWYPNGPSLNHLPLPFPDPQRPWGIVLVVRISVQGTISLGMLTSPTKKV